MEFWVHLLNIYYLNGFFKLRDYVWALYKRFCKTKACNLFESRFFIKCGTKQTETIYTGEVPQIALSWCIYFIVYVYLFQWLIMLILWSLIEPKQSSSLPILTCFFTLKMQTWTFIMHIFFPDRFCKLLEENLLRERTANFFYVFLFGAKV